MVKKVFVVQIAWENTARLFLSLSLTSDPCASQCMSSTNVLLLLLLLLVSFISTFAS